MADNIKDFFISTLDKRISNPVVSNFIVSWLLWNYRLILILFSSDKADAKINTIENIGFPFYGHFVHLFLGPFLSAALIIILLPFFERCALRCQWWQENRTKAAQMRASCREPIDIEQSVKLNEELLRVKELFGNGEKTISDLRYKSDKLEFEVNSLRLAFSNAKSSVEFFESEKFKGVDYGNINLDKGFLQLLHDLKQNEFFVMSDFTKSESELSRVDELVKLGLTDIFNGSVVFTPLGNAFYYNAIDNSKI